MRQVAEMQSNLYALTPQETLAARILAAEARGGDADSQLRGFETALANPEPGADATRQATDVMVEQLKHCGAFFTKAHPHLAPGHQKTAASLTREIGRVAEAWHTPAAEPPAEEPCNVYRLTPQQANTGRGLAADAMHTDARGLMMRLYTAFGQPLSDDPALQATAGAAFLLDRSQQLLADVTPGLPAEMAATAHGLMAGNREIQSAWREPVTPQAASAPAPDPDPAARRPAAPAPRRPQFPTPDPFKS